MIWWELNGRISRNESEEEILQRIYSADIRGTEEKTFATGYADYTIQSIVKKV